jgi:3-hydroxyacyl-CoA dehydrogenase
MDILQHLFNICFSTAKAIGDGWRRGAEAGDEHLSKDLVRPIRLMDKLVSEGKLGVKTGQGIYKY